MTFVKFMAVFLFSFLFSTSPQAKAPMGSYAHNQKVAA